MQLLEACPCSMGGESMACVPKVAWGWVSNDMAGPASLPVNTIN